MNFHSILPAIIYFNGLRACLITVSNLNLRTSNWNSVHTSKSCTNTIWVRFELHYVCVTSRSFQLFRFVRVGLPQSKFPCPFLIWLYSSDVLLCTSNKFTSFLNCLLCSIQMISHTSSMLQFIGTISLYIFIRFVRLFQFQRLFQFLILILTSILFGLRLEYGWPWVETDMLSFNQFESTRTYHTDDIGTTFLMLKIITCCLPGGVIMMSFR